MKACILLLSLAVINFTYGGVVPASTTLIRSSSSIAHSPSLFYSQQPAPLALAYRTPVTYSSPVTYSAPVTYAHHAVAPAVYSQHLFAPAAHYSSPVLSHGPVFAQQSIFAQYPGLIAQNPLVGSYPVAQAPGIAQYPGVVQGPSQIPIQGGSPVIDAVNVPQNPPQQLPVQPPQQSPILSGGSPGTTLDDDTVSIEAA